MSTVPVPSGQTEPCAKTESPISAPAPTHAQHVVVGMSGGVDSSVAALLLHRQGYRVTGVYMENWDAQDELGRSACRRDDEFRDVQAVCEHIGISATKVNLVQEYWNAVFSPCLEQYEAGFTPNPDILCNQEIKFKAFPEIATKLGADFVATGHYAALRCDPLGDSTKRVLFAAKDDSKDQSYFLSGVNGAAFERVLFPLADLCKSQVREIAAKEGLVTAAKKDSVGICFIGKRHFGDFIHEYIPKQPGFFISVDGHPLGDHKGFAAYTVGQGAKIQGRSEKWFVVGKRKRDHAVIVAPGTKHPALFTDSLFASTAHFNWIAGGMPASLAANQQLRCLYRVRYRQTLGHCTVSLASSREVRGAATKMYDWESVESLHGQQDTASRSNIPTYLRVEFDHPQRAATAQQSLVLYREDGLCFGGGPISATGCSYFERRKRLPDNVSDWHSQ